MPIITHAINIYALVAKSRSEYNIKPAHEIMPKIGNSGTKGTLKGLFRFGSVFLKIITAIHIAMNAVNVP